MGDEEKRERERDNCFGEGGLVDNVFGMDDQ